MLRRWSNGSLSQKHFLRTPLLQPDPLGLWFDCIGLTCLLFRLLLGLPGLPGLLGLRPCILRPLRLVLGVYRYSR